jgi:hypothetical protein
MNGTLTMKKTQIISNDIRCNILKKSKSCNLFIWNKACKKKSKGSTHVMFLVKLLELTTKLKIFGAHLIEKKNIQMKKNLLKSLFWMFKKYKNTLETSLIFIIFLWFQLCKYKKIFPPKKKKNNYVVHIVIFQSYTRL